MEDCALHIGARCREPRCKSFQQFPPLNTNHSLTTAFQSLIPTLAPSVTMTGPIEDKPEITDDKDWTKGDLHLISSDNVRFSVYGAVLAWASPVFADMLGIPGAQERTIHLTDPSFENANTVRLFLQLVTINKEALKLFQRYYTVWWLRLEALIVFLDKYECDRGVAILRDLGSDIALFVRKDGIGPSLLLFASLLNHVGLCSKVLDLYAISSWPEDTDLLKSKTSETFTSFGHAPYSLCCAMPREYVWAITRAGILANPKVGTSAFAHKFVELIMAIQRSTGEHQSS